jgi:phosphoglycerate dehydrogenase-like enzyme
MTPFRVGITHDFAPDGHIAGWIEEPVAELLAPLSELEWTFLPEMGAEIVAAELFSCDAVISGQLTWTAESVSGVDRLTLIAHWGIGVDKIDLRAATENDILVTSSPSSATHESVAESALTFMLALSTHLFEKDRLTKQGRALQARQMPGTLLRDHVIGTVGLGATARKLVEYVRPLGPLRFLAHDPYVTADVAAAIGVQLADLEVVMAESDYLVVMCPLTDQTRGLISAELLRTMKPSAFLLNVARGEIVNQVALTKAIDEGRIAGAALDVSDPEPSEIGDPILSNPKIITTGHAMAWTSEGLCAACEAPCRAVANVYAGRLPMHVVNQDVLLRAGFRAKLERRR